MKYIETIREGERISGIYLCKQRQSAVTKNGKTYENLILQDKTGTVDAKIWDPNSQGIDDFEAMDYIDIMADATSFQGALQLNVKRVRKAREGEYNPADYLPVSEPGYRRNVSGTDGLRQSGAGTPSAGALKEPVRG